MNIADYIPFGHDRAVSRQTLCEATGLSDRQVRQLIEDAQRDGAVILNLQDGAGYFQSEDIKEMTAYYRQERSRALSTLARQKHIRRRLKEMGAQI